MANSVPNCDEPTITYPTGGESLLSTSPVTVTWISEGLEGRDISDSNFYELFFTDRYDSEEDMNWMQIASLPSNARSFSWNIPATVRSSKCRVAVRCKNFRGATSELSISNGDFTINTKSMVSPSVVKPTSGHIYRQTLPIIFDHSAIKGSVSQRSFYRVYYSSETHDIDWNLLVDNANIDTNNIYIDTSSWLAASDYVLKIVLVDDDGNQSDPSYVRNIIVNPLPYFILDSKPPKGSLNISGNSRYVNNRNIRLNSDAFDEATTVSSMSISEEGSNDSESTIYNKILTWRVSSGDGEKVIKASFVDAAGNSSDNRKDYPITTYYNDDNQSINSLIFDTDDEIYFAVNGNSLDFINEKTVRASTPFEVTSIAKYNGLFYFGVISSENKGSLYKEAITGTLSSVSDFSAADSRIMSMVEYKDNLYIGLQNGNLYKFDGTTVSLVSNRGNTISKLLSDNLNLYLFVDNDNNVEVYDGTSFLSVSISDARS